MPPEPLELRPTIDRGWLESAAELDPVAHAYALWDLDRLPTEVRFVSGWEGGRCVGYLLVWQAPGSVPVVHWMAPPRSEWASALPTRPLRVHGPPEIAPFVRASRGPCLEHPLLLEVAAAGTVPPPVTSAGPVRRLDRGDLPAVERLAAGSDDELARGYLALDPEAETIFGGFEAGELVAVARASVRRPSVWFVSGVFVLPNARNRRWGQAVTRAVMEEARRAGACSALFVREARADARAAYDRLGFHPVARRTLFDCGAAATA